MSSRLQVRSSNVCVWCVCVSGVHACMRACVYACVCGCAGTLRAPRRRTACAGCRCSLQRCGRQRGRGGCRRSQAGRARGPPAVRRASCVPSAPQTAAARSAPARGACREWTSVSMQYTYTCSAHAVHMQCTCSAHAVHMQCTLCAHAVHMQCTLCAARSAPAAQCRSGPSSPPVAAGRAAPWHRSPRRYAWMCSTGFLYYCGPPPPAA